jgi:hypothetical protein
MKQKVRISDIEADKALKTLLEGNVTLAKSATSTVTLDVYASYERPNTGLADEFISCYNNGTITSVTHPFGMFTGYLAVSVYCKAESDTTAKRKNIKKLLLQVEDLINEKKVIYNDISYFFQLTPTPITPTTVSTTTGYSTTVLNVMWHTV